MTHINGFGALERGVDGYGSMKGLIRLRNEGDAPDDDDEEEGGSSESDVEEHLEVERRLDHDLSRFEMIYPNYGGTDHILENRVDDQIKFKVPNMKPSGYAPSSSKPLGPRNNKSWKGKKGNDKRNSNNWKELPVGINSGAGVGNGSGGGHNPPTLNDLQQHNRLKARRFFSKKKFNHGGKSAPFAPRNTTSFLIRAKKAGGITSLVSPCPVTPAVLPTPKFSPSREVLVDMAKEEWGVDGYGSMKGLIRLRNEGDAPDDDDEEEGGSSESDVEEHLEVERRLDHDLSRFEMIYPNYGGTDHILENRVDDQDSHIAQLEDENLILKDRLFLMEREFDKLRKRLQSLETHRQGEHGFIVEVVENDSENECGSRGYGRSVEENNEPTEGKTEGDHSIQYSEANKNGGNQEMAEPKGSDSNYSNAEKGLQGMEGVKGVADLHMEVDDVVKNKENMNADIESKMEERDLNVAVDKEMDCSIEEGSVPVSAEDTKVIASN